MMSDIRQTKCDKTYSRVELDTQINIKGYKHDKEVHFPKMATKRPITLLLLPFLFAIAAASFDDYDYNREEKPVETCDPKKCLPPKCNCFGNRPNSTLSLNQVPQFVMLTFDDAITPVNIKTYRSILTTPGRKNKGNGCRISATFFVCHEYNDYQIANELYEGGNEIAVHSISHETNTDIWKNGNYTRWKEEMVGMRTILQECGNIPQSEIMGHRAPFLQSAGDTTFRMLSENNFLYDSSMPTRNHIDPPLWPYTLDYGYPQDCQIQPCPKEAYPGLWLVPMVQFKKDKSFCAMADACIPLPKTANETKHYLLENFYRHYRTNKAPFPVFLHEAWLQDKSRLKGYQNFVDDILKLDDVFIVAVREVIEYMKNPVSIEEYVTQPCYSTRRPGAGSCNTPLTCQYPRRNRYMRNCNPCPRRYPWIGNPEGNLRSVLSKRSIIHT